MARTFRENLTPVEFGLGVLVSIVWFLVVPAVFVFLYFTIQLQIAAKDASPLGAMPSLAVIYYSNKARELTATDQAIQSLSSKIASQALLDDRSYIEAKTEFVSQLITIAAGTGVDFDITKCRASAGGKDGSEAISGRNAAVVCHDMIMPAAVRAFHHLPSVEQAALRQPMESVSKQFTKFLVLSAVTQSDQARLLVLHQKLDENRSSYNSLLKEMGPQLVSAVNAYDQSCAGWGICRSAFVLPDGATVSIFTGVMGAIGAAVYSLFVRIRNVAVTGTDAAESVVRSYLTRPLLGALAGFMVYFVLSAGTSLLVQGGGKETASMVNTVSPAALASLGVLAGLAAERAMQWLTSKAATIFPLDAPKAGDQQA